MKARLGSAVSWRGVHSHQMLPKQHRLSASTDFKKVFKEGKFAGGNFISLKVKKSGREQSRVGFVVGQKIAKKATARNKIKRQLREAVKDYVKETRGAVDIIVIPNPQIAGKSFSEISGEIRKAFEKAGVL